MRRLPIITTACLLIVLDVFFIWSCRNRQKTTLSLLEQLSPAVMPERSVNQPAAFAVAFLTNPVSVIAQFEWHIDEYKATIELKYGQDSFEIISPTSAGVAQEAIDRLKERIGWKDGYLFIDEESGGGNAWRANVDRVFAIRNRRLIYIGSICRRFHPDSAVRLGPGYRDGWFYDVYNKLEFSMDCHANGIMIYLAMKERGGSFVVDMKRTWELNRDTCFTNEKRISEMLTNVPAADPSRHQNLTVLVAENAAIAKYCQQSKLLASTLNIGKRILRKDDFGQVLIVLREIKAGDLPHCEWDDYDSQWAKKGKTPVN